jgi:hypothetical protein
MGDLPSMEVKGGVMEVKGGVTKICYAFIGTVGKLKLF